MWLSSLRILSDNEVGRIKVAILQVHSQIQLIKLARRSARSLPINSAWYTGLFSRFFDAKLLGINTVIVTDTLTCLTTALVELSFA